MNTLVLRRIAVAAAMLACAHYASASPMLGTWLPTDAEVKLWMVNLDLNGPTPGGYHGVNAVAANVPDTTPDLKFHTSLIQYTSDYKPNTIQGFFVPGVVKNPIFSDEVNSLVGAKVDPNTALWSETCIAPDLKGVGCWGTLMEITGKINIATGGHVKINHDDGVSLKLNGQWMDCFKDGSSQHYVASDGPETCIYNGPSGLIDFELIYSEGYSGPARLTMAVPEPATLVLVSIALAGLGLGTGRNRKV